MKLEFNIGGAPEAGREARSDTPRPTSPRTIPEQIADEIGKLIIDGHYRAGQRLIEQDLAGGFGVSRGPVRESLRILERRRLVDIVPRKGAYVRAFSLGSVADLFNVRIALAALAVQLVAIKPEPGYLETLRRRVDELEAMAEDEAADPLDFAMSMTRSISALAKGSGNELIVALLTDLRNQTVWTTIWKAPLDYRDRQTRADVAARMRRLIGHIEARDPANAVKLLRKVLEDNRDEAIASLMGEGQDGVGPQKLIRTV